MKRLLASIFISSYLSILAYGVVCHALTYRSDQHPMMYFIVWDMFCGWSAFADGTAIVAEGESGKFYELAPAPWGEIVPFGSMQRHDYDYLKRHYRDIALNTLRHTQHEPITRIFVVEAAWSKKFDLPDALWKERFDVPKDPKKYYRLRAEMDGEGMLVRHYTAWLDSQGYKVVADNPRLMNDSRNGQSFFAVDQSRPAGSVYMTSPKGN
jgi:hypothetical protein